MQNYKKKFTYASAHVIFFKKGRFFLECHAYTSINELGTDAVGLKTELHKHVVDHVVFEDKLHVAPTVLIRARFHEIIAVENPSVKRFAVHGNGIRILTGFVIGFEVLDGVNDIKSHMQTGGQTTDDELRLDTESHSETVLHLAMSEKSLAEIGHRRTGIIVGVLAVDSSVVTVIEGIKTATDTEDRNRYPVRSRFEGRDAVELLTVLVIRVVVLSSTAGCTDLHGPGLGDFFMQLFGSHPFGSPILQAILRTLFFVLSSFRMVSYPKFCAE